MVQYDPEVIQKSADRLYRRADSIVATWTLLGVLIGAAMVLGIFSSLSRAVLREMEIGPLVPACIGAIVGGLGGYAIGSGKALILRMQAQAALCQMQIEENTRQAVAVTQVA